LLKSGPFEPGHDLCFLPRHSHLTLTPDFTSSEARSSAPPQSTASLHQANDQEQNYSSDGRVNYRRDNAGTEDEANLWEQPTADKCSHNTYGKIGDDAHSPASNDETC